MLRIQSNGMGQQSVAMYFMSCMGYLPRFDYSIFCDPGRERKQTYQYVDYLQGWAKNNNGIPLVVVKEKDLYRDLTNNTNSTQDRFASIPAFTKNEDGSTGMLKRQCTSEYKTNLFYKKTRELLGIGKANFPEMEVYIGITFDELRRVRKPEHAKSFNVYPFCNLKTSKKNKPTFLDYDFMTRSDVVNFLRKNNLPIPPKSACTFCPYQSDREWLDLKQNDPEEWEMLVELDRKIRNSTKKGVKNHIYLHDSLLPLDQVKFQENQTEIREECEGICHV